MIAATNRNLPELVAAGTFREDLLYRLRVIHLQVPPLRERPEDIRALAQHFLARGGHRVTLTDAAWQQLIRYRWPGNVREVQNVMEQIAWLAASPETAIGVDQLPPVFRAGGHAMLPTRERRRQVADELFQAIVQGGSPSGITSIRCFSTGTLPDMTCGNWCGAAWWRVRATIARCASSLVCRTRTTNGCSISSRRTTAAWTSASSATPTRLPRRLFGRRCCHPWCASGRGTATRILMSLEDSDDRSLWPRRQTRVDTGVDHAARTSARSRVAGVLSPYVSAEGGRGATVVGMRRLSAPDAGD